MNTVSGKKPERESLPKIFGAMGLALRAGKLTIGSELVEHAVRDGKAELVLIARDVSDNTAKKLTNALTTCDVPYLFLPADMREIAQALGKTSLVSSAAITGAGFVNIIKKLRINTAENTTNGGVTIYGDRCEI